MCLIKEGTETVSSYRLAEVCHIKPSIIRKDLSYFGELGKRGVGYNVNDLVGHIRRILGLVPPKRVALVGVGNIGKAVLSYPNFESEGFKIVIAFDNKADTIGNTINHIQIEDIANLEDKIKSEKIQLAILTVPEEVAPVIARRLVKAGVGAVLSFAPCQLAMPNDIKVTCIDLSTEMARLVYFTSQQVFSKQS